MPAVHRNKTILVQIAAVIEIGRLLHPVGQADVILASCAADGWKFGIAVHIDFYLALTPPLSGRQIANADKSTHKTAFVFTLGQHNKVLF